MSLDDGIDIKLGRSRDIGNEAYDGRRVTHAPARLMTMRHLEIASRSRYFSIVAPLRLIFLEAC